MPARAWAEANEQADAEAASALCACSGPPVGERFVFQEADMVRSGSQGQSPLPTPPRVDGGGGLSAFDQRALEASVHSAKGSGAYLPWDRASDYDRALLE